MNTPILTLVGVLFFQAFYRTEAGQSAIENDQTTENVRERRLDAPEVVLQLKYDGGELNRIYLTQFRKEAIVTAAPVPSRSSLCTDLCYAGLGGEACGSTCPKMMPVGLKLALQHENVTNYSFGVPRVAVCPTLCDNLLGEPLCNCNTNAEASGVEWNAVCSTFCETDNYVLNGCPPCEEKTTTMQAIKATSTRVLNTSEGWQSWCNVQCHQGQGGAACNCDRAPFQ